LVKTLARPAAIAENSFDLVISLFSKVDFAVEVWDLLISADAQIHMHCTYQLELLELADDIFEEVGNGIGRVRPPLLSALPSILINEYHWVF
jgi:hypothetical protein